MNVHPSNGQVGRYATGIKAPRLPARATRGFVARCLRRVHRLLTREMMRSILLYFIGVPIPIILLLAMCTHHF
jgi:hypothetical protein